MFMNIFIFDRVSDLAHMYPKTTTFAPNWTYFWYNLCIAGNAKVVYIYNGHGKYRLKGVFHCAENRQSSSRFFREVGELMNIYVTRVLCMM